MNNSSSITVPQPNTPSSWESNPRSGSPNSFSGKIVDTNRKNLTLPRKIGGRRFSPISSTTRKTVDLRSQSMRVASHQCTSALLALLILGSAGTCAAQRVTNHQREQAFNNGYQSQTARAQQRQLSTAQYFGIINGKTESLTRTFKEIGQTLVANNRITHPTTINTCTQVKTSQAGKMNWDTVNLPAGNEEARAFYSKVHQSYSNPLFSLSTFIRDSGIDSIATAKLLIRECMQHCPAGYNLASALKGLDPKSVKMNDPLQFGILIYNPPLTYAIFNESPMLASALIDAHVLEKVSLNVRDAEGKTPLMAAAMMRDRDTSDQLMHIISLNKDKPMARELLTAQDKDQKNLLHHTSRFGNDHLFEQLCSVLDSEALSSLLTQKDSYGKTPLDYCKSNKKTIRGQLNNLKLNPTTQSVQTIKTGQQNIAAIINDKLASPQHSEL